jgi:hypothetical protein
VPLSFSRVQGAALTDLEAWRFRNDSVTITIPSLSMFSTGMGGGSGVECGRQGTL